MKIKKRKIDNKAERQIITGMIVSDQVLTEIQPIFDANLLSTPFVRTVAKWCIQYHQQYGKAPGKNIQDIFNSERRGSLNEDTADLIGDFLASISDDYERADKFNSRYVLDKAEDYLQAASARALTEDVQAELSKGNTQDAIALIASYKRRERPTNDWVDPFNDQQAIRDAFENDVKPLFTIPGELGNLLNDFFVRDALIGFMGKEKIGKTWTLMELAFRALKFRCNAAVFQVGDMSGPQMIRRFGIRLAGRSNKKKYCGTIWVPVLDCEKNQNDRCDRNQRTSPVGLKEGAGPQDAPSDYIPCSVCMGKSNACHPTIWYVLRKKIKPLTWKDAFKFGRKLTKRSRGKGLRMVTKPNKDMSVSNIVSQLDIWETFDGFVPDVVIIDYADILKGEPGDERKETRDQQNGTWQALRALSQKKHCLVITATQTDAAAYDTKDLKLKNFSEDKRKYSHVTVMPGLNQTEEEKDRGVMRVNILLAREEVFDIRRMVHVLQCLQIGRPFIASFRKKFKKKKKEDK